MFSEPEKINEDDIYKVESVSFIPDKYNSKTQLELFILLKNKKGNDLKIPIKDDYSIIGQNNLVELNKYKTDYDFIMAEKVKAIAERNKTIYQLYGKKIGDKIIAGEIEIGMDTLAITTMRSVRATAAWPCMRAASRMHCKPHWVGRNAIRKAVGWKHALDRSA